LRNFCFIVVLHGQSSRSNTCCLIRRGSKFVGLLELLN
jgi:hypothetical protein